jgi:DNA-binding LacI/PurR family transcriptional regulator
VKDANAPASTIRALARQLRLSPTTVSESLRGVARVSSATAARVRAAAQAAGYRCNPLFGSVLSQVRRSGGLGFRGALGIVDLEESDRPPGAVRFHELLVAGAKRRCAELGFSLARFLLGPDGLQPLRLNAVLTARNISGLLVLPAYWEIHLETVEWSKLAGVYLDRIIQHPALHCVSVDHYAAIWMAMEELAARGYRRPGLVLQRRQDERISHRLEGGFLTFCAHDACMKPAPVLAAPQIDEQLFTGWFCRNQPDVVLGHGRELLDLIRKAGGRVPQTVGFVSLNSSMFGDRPCAALDLRPELLGSLGTDLLVGQILRGERGIPAAPSYTSSPARWVDGPTVRSR